MKKQRERERTGTGVQGVGKRRGKRQESGDWLVLRL